jgi:hypothetical protein
MRFLLGVIDGATNTASGDEMEAINAFNDGLRAKNQLLLAIGLANPSRSKVIDNTSGSAVVTEGPLNDTKEFIAGLWLIEVDSQEAAEDLAKGASKACNRKIELRQLLG